MKKEKAGTEFMYFNLVAVSVSLSVGDVQFIRKTLGRQGRSIRVISMTENEEGVKNMHATIQESDGIMEVRGDKGTESPPVRWSWHRRC